MKTIYYYSMQTVEEAVDQLKDAAKKGIGVPQYVWLSENINPSDAEWQKRFCKFYRVYGGGRGKEWREAFFEQMAKVGDRPTFSDVLIALSNDPRTAGRVEKSFASKLLHTLNPHSPIIDKYIIRNTGVKLPEYKSIEEAVVCYDELVGWFDTELKTARGQEWIALFDAAFPEYRERLTAEKKVDFLLWMIR